MELKVKYRELFLNGTDNFNNWLAEHSSKIFQVASANELELVFDFIDTPLVASTFVFSIEPYPDDL